MWAERALLAEMAWGALARVAGAEARIFFVGLCGPAEAGPCYKAFSLRLHVLV
jgi:hypothetical protein